MDFTTKLLAAFNRRTRWSEGHIFAVTPEQIGIVEGIRASFAVAIILAADIWLHVPDLAYGAVAAFWTCLCDPSGSDRARLKVLANFAVGSTAAISLAAYAAHWGPVIGGVGLFLLVLICGLTRSYRPTFGPMPAPAGLIAAIAAVVGVTSPRSIEGALHLGGCFLLGAVGAMILCVYIWRTHPRAPARRALISIFARLEDMARSLSQLDTARDDEGHRRAVRFSIERGREIVARLVAGRTRFSQGIDAAGRVFAALMALAHYRAANGQPLDTEELTLIEGLRRLLEHALQQSGQTLMTDGAVLLENAAKQSGVVGHAVVFATEALVELARHWEEPEPEEHAGEAATGHLSLKIPAPVWRQALRVAVAVSISYSLGAWYDVSFSYWGTIATLVLMQPFGANTWLRVIERAAGSVVGGVLTAILIARLSGPVEMLFFIAPLSAAVIALRLVNYGLFVLFVTPMFVLVSDFIHPASHLIAARAVNEIIGACIGLAGALLLWPEKENNALADTILAALSANLAFAAAALRADAGASNQLDPLRRDAGVTSARAEIARQRLLLQGRARTAHLDRIREILAALRAICGAANVRVIMRNADPNACDETRAGRYEALAEHLRKTFSGSHESPAIAAMQSDDSDDLGHAVHALSLAVQDYAAETKPNIQEVENA